MEHARLDENDSTEDQEIMHIGEDDSEVSGYDYSSSPPAYQSIKGSRRQCIKATASKAKILLPILLLIIANSLYLISLEPCSINNGEEKCTNVVRKKAPQWIAEVFICSICFFMMLKLYSPVWKIVAIANSVALFLYQSGLSIYDHGGINRIFLPLGIIVCYILYCVYKGIKKCYEHHKLLPLCSILLIILFIFIGGYKITRGSCNDWTKGIGGKRLINDDKYCTVPIPTYCELDIRNGIIDLNIFGKQCSEIETKFGMSYASQELQARENVKRVGLTRDEDIPVKYSVNRNKYRDYVRAHMFDMDDPSVPQSVKYNTEFVIDMTDPDHHKLIVEVKHNKTRAAEQKQLRDEIIAKEKQEGTYDSRIDTNVLMFYIDDISRAHFMRKLPKTTAWLDKFTTEEYPDNDVYQFFRYHSVYFGTYTSNNAMFYGQIGGKVEDPTYNMYQTYSDNGYVTGFFDDGCEQHQVFFADKKPKVYTFDHFAGSIACEGKYGEPKSDSEIFFFDGKYSMFRKCRYGEQMHQIQIDYLSKFWEAYPDNRKFFRTDFSDAHELTGNLVRFLDDDVVSFFEQFYEKGHMEDTTVLFLSDHGAHGYTLHLQVIPDNSRYLENYLGLMFLVMPSSIPDDVKTTLAKNEQAFVGSFDFFSSFSTLANNKQIKTKYATSYDYFHEVIPTDHDCTNKTEFTVECWCMNDKQAVMDQFNERWIFYVAF